MNLASILVGTAIVIAASGWYPSDAGSVDLQGPSDRPTLPVALELLAGDSMPEAVPELLASAHVVLLRYHAIPEQTATGQARVQFEDRADARLAELGQTLADADADAGDPAGPVLTGTR